MEEVWCLRWCRGSERQKWLKDNFQLVIRRRNCINACMHIISVMDLKRLFILFLFIKNSCKTELKSKQEREVSAIVVSRENIFAGAKAKAKSLAEHEKFVASQRERQTKTFANRDASFTSKKIENTRSR